MMNVEQSEIVPDEIEHRLDRRPSEERQPLGFGLSHIFVAMLRREDGPDRLQILARVHAFGNAPDLFAEGFAVAQVSRAGERIDLPAGVVYVIFLRDSEARCLENTG